jgi:hypothetical protein
MTQRVHEDCSAMIFYDVKVYPFNGNTFIQMVPTTSATLNANHEVISVLIQNKVRYPGSLKMVCPITALRGDYHRVVWTVADGCGNVNFVITYSVGGL